jgi:hypothetical protein
VPRVDTGEIAPECPEGYPEYATADRNMHASETRHVQVDPGRTAGTPCVSELPLNAWAPVSLLVTSQGCRAGQDIFQARIQDSRKFRDDLEAEQVTPESQIPIGGVLSPANAVLSSVRPNFVPG